MNDLLIETPVVEESSTKGFAQLGLSQDLVNSIEKLGFETPTEIQSKAIPLLLEDNSDFVGLAQTGTGKTATFGLPLVDLVDADSKTTQALVLAPTRELCLQIAKELLNFASHKRYLNVLPVYGGADIVKQMKDLRKGVQIIAATPGRLKDLISRKAVNLSEIRYVILDEADEMLNMGFKDELDTILASTPEDKLTWLFSATMPAEVRRIANEYMYEPLEISIGHKNSTNKNIDHQYIVTRPSERYPALCRFLDFEEDVFSIVFCRTRRDSKEVADRLIADGYKADALHGDLSQSQRDRVMKKFRNKHIEVLVATDVAARGIDVDDITHVFHFNLPDDISFYTHRSGRTGRIGKKGISLVFAHPKDLSILRQLERKIKTEFSAIKIPTGQEICEKQVMQYVGRLKAAPVSEDLQRFMPKIEQELADLSKTELIEKLSATVFNKFLEVYRHAPDLNEKDRSRQKKSAYKGDRKRFFINIGEIDVENKGQFISFICKQARIDGSLIGKIEMQKKHTFFEVAEHIATTVERSLNNGEYKNRSIRIDEAPRRERRNSGGGGRRRRSNNGGYRKNKRR